MTYKGLARFLADSQNQEKIFESIDDVSSRLLSGQSFPEIITENGAELIAGLIAWVGALAIEADITDDAIQSEIYKLYDNWGVPR